MSATKKMWAGRLSKFNPVGWFVKSPDSKEALKNENRNVSTGMLAFVLITTQFGYLASTDSLLWYNHGDSLATKEFVTKVVKMDLSQCTRKGIDERKEFSQRTSTPILNKHVVNIYRKCEDANRNKNITQQQLKEL